MNCSVCHSQLTDLNPNDCVTSSSDKQFFDRLSFIFAGTRFPFPAPHRYEPNAGTQPICAQCSHQRRLAFRNELSLYHRASAISGERILSLYHSQPLWGAPYQVMLESEWRGDGFDPYSCGREIDFSRSFFEQYAELHKAVPRMSIVNLHNENSPYTSHTGYSKNCYLLPCSEHCEDCYYGRFLQKCKNCVDCTSAHRCELCYECFEISDCYSCAFLSLSENCNDCYFSENLIGCHNCLFCSNLHRGEYQIFNQRVTPAEFKQHLADIFASSESLEAAYRQWQHLREDRGHRPANIQNCEDCTGDFLRDSKNCEDCISVTSCQDCRDIIIGYDLKDCRNCCNFYLGSELNYEILGSTELYHCAFGFYIFRSSEILYSEYVYDSKRLFGCVGITRGENCILNRQYSAEDYQTLSKRLAEHMIATGEWGAQLPANYSPFGYNETVAADLYPLSKEVALARGFLWRDPEDRPAPESGQKESHTGPAVSTDISTGTCSSTGAQFRLIEPERDFYQRHGYPLPTLSPRARHQRREALRFPAAFRTTNCKRCGTAVVTNVPAALEGTLRCEECYRALL